MSGFVLTYRAAIDHPLFQKDVARLGAWLWLVSKACWKPTRFDIRGQIVELQRGELCVSREQLATAWGWSSSAVERFLTRLQTEQMIGRATGQGRTIITICNYSKYQDDSSETGQPTGQPTGQQSDSHRTAKEQGNKGTREEEGSNEPSRVRAHADDQPLDVPADDPPKEDPPAPPKAKAAITIDTPLPDDWQPALGPKRAAIVRAWPVGMLEHQLDRFRQHAINNQRLAKDWNAAFGTWVDRADKGKKHYGNAGTTTFGGAARSWPQRDNRDGFQRALDAELGLDPFAQSARPTGQRDDPIPTTNPRLC